jgi:preprotein translocase subunit SecE
MDKNKKENSLVKYVKDSVEELKKVKWPTKNETINNTLLVIIICIVMGIFLGLIDYGLTQFLYKILNITK